MTGSGPPFDPARGSRQDQMAFSSDRPGTALSGYSRGTGHETAFGASAAGTTPLLHRVLVLAWLLGMYTYVRLQVAPGVPFPAAIGGSAGVALLLLNLAQVQKHHVKPLAFMLIIAFVSAIFGAGFTDHLVERLQTLIVFTYSLAAGYGIYLEFSRWSRQGLAKLFGWTSLALVVGAAMENYTPLQAVSEAFRSMAFPQGTIYIADVRDMNLFSIIRPKLFTAEPSYLAIFLLFSSTLWLALSEWRWRYLGFGVLLACGIFLIRSPVLFGGFVTGLATYMALSPSNPAAARSERLTRAAVFLGAAVAGITLLIVAANTIYAARIELIASGYDDSFNIRVTGPFMVALESMSRYPILGTGIGGREVIRDLVLDVYLPLIYSIDNIYERVESTITNAFWLHWIQFGIGGGICMAWAIFSLIRNLSSGHWVFPCLIILAFSQTMGGYVGPRFWMIVFVTLVVTQIVRMEQNHRAQRQWYDAA